MRYVEASPLRAKRVLAAQNWSWSSLGGEPKPAAELLDDWPVKRPRNWTALVNEVLPEAHRVRVISSLERGRPLGDDPWTAKTAKRFGLQYTVNPRGRPPKKADRRLK